MSTKVVRKSYTPIEKEQAVTALQDNGFCDFEIEDARAIVEALHAKGFRIINVGLKREPLSSGLKGLVS